ncbi:MAG TPA: nuclear transport factor 2 family protein [Acidobacteriaceae bacterium]|jgi:hypothetical protein|nr:nuclear transport factor 2 family protein [Acidobacteriaceae bacterium]
MPHTFPLSPEQARHFAEDWIAAWNARDLAAILRHYAPTVVLTSPVAARVTGQATVTGIDALSRYFARGLELYPELRFGLHDVFTGHSSVVLLYANQSGTRTAEWMDFNEEGQVIRVVAQYAA